MAASCIGCKFLYTQGEGYSNYTWLADAVHCALDLNPKLADGPDKPSDWNLDVNQDNWPKTQYGRCNRYAEGVFIRLDVDGEDHPADYSTDQEQIDAIRAHARLSPRAKEARDGTE